ncbi:MAG: hypothetical protein RLZZ501_1338 [Pseudomonadota bacterium]|jgi:hypothetical protein
MLLPSTTRFAARIVLPRPALDHAIELAHAIDGEFTPPEVEDHLREDITTLLEHFDHPFTGCWWEDAPLDPAEAPPEAPAATADDPAAVPVEYGLLLLRQGDTPLEIEVVVEILQAALRRFGLTGAITLEWCGDGSGPDHCWGAAVVLTADHAWAFNSRAWLAQALATHGLAGLTEAAPPLASPLFTLAPPPLPVPPAPEAAPEADAAPAGEAEAEGETTAPDPVAAAPTAG